MTDLRPRTAPALPPARRRRSGAAGRALLVAVMVVGIGVLTACSGAPQFDREAAVTRVVDAGTGAIDRHQAECYVDEVSNQLGTPLLEAGAQPEPEQIRRLTSIKIDCFGVASLGATTSVTGAPGTAVDGAMPQPMTHGSDPALDALWDQCAAGSGLACDQLFDQAPVRSEYEDFAGTCGFRTQELRCADVYTTATTVAPVASVP